MDHDIAGFKNELLQLDEQREAGTLTPEQYEQDRKAIENRILDAVMRAQDPQLPQPATDAGPASSRQTRRWLWLAGLVSLLLVVAAVVYVAKRPATPVLALGGKTNTFTASGAADPHLVNNDQMGAMIEKLAARLKDKPGDAAGWAMLARSYGALGRSAEAVDAYAKAEELSKNDAGLLADYADALAVRNNRTLAGEPMKLITRALKLDPRNVKALAMAGSDAFERKDYSAAVAYWEQVVAIGGAENLFAQQIQGTLMQARQLAGLNSSATIAGSGFLASTRIALPASAASASVPGTGIQGTVTLAPALSRSVTPEDTVFIFARAAEGSRMPLALLRRQVKDLPLAFTLDDSSAMSAQATLSKAGRVTVSARISKSGKAVPEKGDLLGESAPVTVGVKGLVIEIKDAVKQ
jgi:cytochrome c-type biogenesis protein CcmH